MEYKCNLFLSFFFLNTLITSPCFSEEVKTKKYNIVFIMSDDHAYQMISCYNKNNIKTPNIDRIAEDGIKFTNSFVANSISGPSRACILTGKHSHANGFKRNSTDIFDGSQETMPKILQRLGYQTAIVGKWHLKSIPTGFNYWEILPEQGDYYNPDFIKMNNDTIRESGYVTDLITEKSLKWLEDNKDKPFCLFIHHKAVHRNWISNIKDLKQFEDRTYEVPENFYDNYNGRIASANQKMKITEHLNIKSDLKIYSKDKKIKGKYEKNMSPIEIQSFDSLYANLSEEYYNCENKDLWKFQRYMRDYSKVVKSLDENVGIVYDYLLKNNLLENTLIVYTSDQGFYMGEHGWFDKRFMYEESMRTPLVMHLPSDFKCKGEVDKLVQNIDIAPTFIELAGGNIPKDIHGMSLLPIFKGVEKKKWRTSLYYHYYDYPGAHYVKRHYGIRTSRYKLIHFYDDINEWEFYDLKSDPYEMNNLYSDKRYDKHIKKIKEDLVKLQELYNDTLAIKLNKM